MTPQEFIDRWRASTLTERQGAQLHFVQLCNLLGVPAPADGDTSATSYTFEKGVMQTGGGSGWADVWKRGCFGWEYKSRGENLGAALRQLKMYAGALENPPLLIVSDMEKIEVHTNWTNMVQETDVFTFDDLLDSRRREKLRRAFLDTEVDAWRPGQKRADLTRDVANKFVTVAQRLRERGEKPDAVAHFVNRLLFCMFAEDVGLLPNKMFKKMLQASLNDPKSFTANARTLFAAMAKQGGRVGFETIEWFNGGLFDDDNALQLDRDDIEIALEAADQDWSNIDPSIMGTLFERGLDPDKRKQLGAHYTDPEKIMMIVNPVIIDPLTREWDEVKEQIAAELDKRDKVKSAAAKTQVFNRATSLKVEFLERLKRFRVLDPACGSGNFLYLGLKALKDIEHRVNTECEALGIERDFPAVGPENMLGIEINPFAAELARVSVWIGEIQWMREHGFDASRNPILKSLDNIVCHDALLNDDGSEYAWPPADAIIGNPPFLGAKLMKGRLGAPTTDRIRAAFSGRLPGFTDLVCYWFEKARAQIVNGRVSRVGLVATKAIAKNTNLPVMRRIADVARIHEAWSNEPWIQDGAAVRVAIACFEKQHVSASPFRLNGDPVEVINPNLTSGLDVTVAEKMDENAEASLLGIQKSGPFDVDGELARAWLRAPLNPNRKPNSAVLKPYWNGDDLSDRPRDVWIIDFPRGESEAVVSQFEKPFAYLRSTPYDPKSETDKRPLRDIRAGARDEHARTRWWEQYWPRPEMRRVIEALPRYLVTGETTEHRTFKWLSYPVLPDKSLIVFARDDDTSFGILQSAIHEAWSTGIGNRMGVGNQRRYNSSYIFETFPFPAGLTPDIPATDYAADPRAQKIAASAKQLNELRENWLNPPDLVQLVPEVVPGYPDRILPRDGAAAAILGKRTLTNLYNERPTWLDMAHRELDAAVAAAYGWTDWGKDGQPDDVILERLFKLNQERAREETSN